MTPAQRRLSQPIAVRSSSSAEAQETQRFNEALLQEALAVASALEERAILAGDQVHTTPRRHPS